MGIEPRPSTHRVVRDQNFEFLFICSLVDFVFTDGILNDIFVDLNTFLWRFVAMNLTGLILYLFGSETWFEFNI